MKVSKYLDRYINDSEYKITITSNYIDINNFIEVLDYSNSKIVVKSINNITTIKGNDLSISKMIDNELLIIGKIISIDL